MTAPSLIVKLIKKLYLNEAGIVENEDIFDLKAQLKLIVEEEHLQNPSATTPVELALEELFHDEDDESLLVSYFEQFIENVENNCWDDPIDTEGL